MEKAKDSRNSPLSIKLRENHKDAEKSLIRFVVLLISVGGGSATVPPTIRTAFAAPLSLSASSFTNLSQSNPSLGSHSLFSSHSISRSEEEWVC
ncbi:uncharacterized protein G2W53_004075 [Senna tora]|uniref:Uncharacterized protein n=1 Tax=Senna tora TaxID=362788 RepID=A0A834XC71_9FABA|nr:uncharacterized protein G2W53_004075 [Senna tora]